jgi:arylsulfatase A
MNGLNLCFFYRYFHDPICMLRQNNMVLLGYQDEPKPWMDDYDGYEESLIKPNKNEPKYSQWSFQKSHMEFIKLQEPKYFELYNMEEDLEQRSDISKDNPELTESMKKMMLNKRKEMLKEGGDWY